ncbi:MAG: S41 family peptidase [Pseudomonadota bacterium]
MHQTTRLFLGFVLTLAGAIGLADASEVDWQETFEPAQLREDFSTLYRGLKSAHADLYAHRDKTSYDQLYDTMSAGFTQPLTRLDTQLAFQRFAAYGNVAHARIEFPTAAFDDFRGGGGRTFPIYLRIVDGVAYVGENYSGNQGIKAGDEIVAINDQPMSAWLARTGELISADTPYIAHSLQEFTFPRELWAVAGEINQFELTLRRDGKLEQATVKATTREAQQKVAADVEKAFALDSSERSYRMVSPSIGYLRPGPFYNAEQPNQAWDNTAFGVFIDQAFESLIAEGAQQLIIDLRENPGGDNSFSDLMLAWFADEPFRFCSAFLIRSSDEAAASNANRLEQQAGAVESVSTLFAKQYAAVPRGQSFEFDIPYAQPREGQRFTGRVFALINRHSYSNAVNVAAIIQDYNLGIIAGEKTSDMATTYGAMEQFTLPNTGIEVGFPKAHIIRPSGERRSDGVAPDWVIRSPVVAGQDDEVLRALIAKIQAD